MHLAQLKISNYKSFFETKEFKFEPGFNVLLGANSSGKSSVLEAIAYNEIIEIPHRSILNSTDVDAQLISLPSIEISFSIALDELNKLFKTQDAYIGIGEKSGHFYSQDLNAVNQYLSNKLLQLDIKEDFSIGKFARLSIYGWPSVWRPINSTQAIPSLYVKNFKGIQIDNRHY